MTPIKIMIVDDEEEFSSTLAERLSLRNYEVREANSGDGALAVLDGQWRPDVVILDLKMPGIDGLATLSLIKQHDPSIAVIMLTGHGSTSSGIEGMRRGLFDYLSKPIDLDELLLAIDKAAAKRP